MRATFTEISFLHFCLQVKVIISFALSYEHMYNMQIKTSVSQREFIRITNHRGTGHTIEIYVLCERTEQLPKRCAAVQIHLMLHAIVGKATRQIVQCAQTLQFWIESKKNSQSSWRNNYINCVNESVMTSMVQKEIRRGLC